MIIPNGELWREAREAGEVRIDPSTGYPVVTDGGWGEKPIACQVVPLSMDLRAMAMADGSPLNGAEYQVLVEGSEWSFERAERVRITSEELGLSLRAFEIKSVKPLVAVGQVELVV